MRKKIILASGSNQRKKLMKLLGIPFSVEVSRVKEQTRISTSCEDLVKHNALLKAQSVGKELSKGIVIGADSVVYLGDKQIIGKPKNLKEAKRNLKILFSQPHWVYTGLAVIDVETAKTIVDYEKTKIFMAHLSDAEIDQYHQLVCPLDKAGGFDIEGHGSLFIRRIEGCYSNVIGLPMAKLVKLLKKLDVDILVETIACP